MKLNSILTAAVTAILITFQISAFAQSDKKLVRQTITKNGVEGKLKFLASDELRGRDTPSPELNIAAKYLATTMMEYGVMPAVGDTSFMQPVQMVSTTPASGGSFTVGDSAYSFDKELLLLAGSSTDFTAETIYLGYGSKDDFEGADINGKIVITRSGIQGESGARAAFEASEEKGQRAKKAGAVALIELFNSPQPNWKILRYYFSGPSVMLNEENAANESDDKTFPRIWLEDVANQRRPYFEEYEGEASIKVEGSKEEKFETYNVVGMLEGSDPKLKDEYVVYSAHYDHVGIGDANAAGDTIYNGTRDNATGSMTVLETAKNFAKKPTRRSALFVFFTGEEKGLLGSEWFVNHPVVPLEQMVYCFNSDNAGYNDTNVVTIVGMERTTIGDTFKEACEEFGLEAIADQMPDQNLYERSDHVNFARKGIPALMYTLGITAFDEEIMKYYHQAADNPNSVDYDYLLKFTRAYVYACRMVGNMKDRPYWTKGDDYYDIGESLYGN